MNKSTNDQSNIFLSPVHTAHENLNNRDPTISNGYDMDENEVMIPMAPSLSLPHSNVPQSKYHREVLRYDNTTVFNMAKEDLVQNDGPLNLHATNSRYRPCRLPSLNTQKSSLDDSGVNSYDDIQDMSFPEELSSLSRTSTSETSFTQYYYKSTSPTMDMCNSDLSGGFANDNFSNSIPSTSSMFHHNDTNSYGLPDHSDEYLLNNLEMNDNEKLVLTNEDYAMLTQGKQGSCLELILNNGEVLYAIIDPSDNDYNSSSPRITLISKDSCMNSERSCSLPDAVDDRVMDQFSGESTYNRNHMSSASPLNCSSTTVNDFVVTSQHYQSTLAPTTMPKTIDSSAGTDNFNPFRDDFNVDNQPFQTIVDTYREIVPGKQHLYENETLLQNTPMSTMNREEKRSLSPGLQAGDPKTDKAASKIDYFPSAVNSIVVSETGKKYPKKYSFYSNNFSSFLNREPIKNVTNRSESNKMFNVSNENASSFEVENSITVERLPENSATAVNANSNSEKSTSCSNVESIVSNIPPSEPFNAQFDSQSLPVSDGDSMGSLNAQIVKQQLNVDEIARNKFFNSYPEVVVNNICDAAVQSRARATLPNAYLSINRIKGDTSQTKPTYGVFARKIIPSKTKFGPMEGVLIKLENDDETSKESETSLHLTVESEDGKFLKLDVSNDETCNWMKFVRPAKSYKEQNLIVNQQGSSLYFTTIENIHPKQELLVWYSVWYSKRRNYKLLTDDPSGELCVENNDFGRRSEDATDEITLQKYGDDVEIISYSAPTSNENEPNKSVAFRNSRFDEIKGENELSMKKLKSSSTHKTTKSGKSAKGLWLCTYCDLTFSNASVMNFHILVHAADDVEKTQSTTSNQADNGCDKVADDNTNHVCPQCNEEFAEKKELISHVAKHGLKIQRWSDNSKPLKERKDNADTQENEMSENLDEPTFECEFCNRNFKSSFALEIHKRFHSSASILECPMCEMTFEKLNEMREHVYTHAVDGVFTCPHCPKSYDRYKFMRKHIRACHSKITFACKLCKKVCKSKHKLRSHMLRHSDEREFLCSICGKLFKRADKLTEHVRNTHSGEREKVKAFETTEKKATNGKKTKKKTMDKVLRIISDDYFYKCYVCNIGFKRRGMLVNHLNQFHPEINLSSIPELNVPILKAYCNFYCLYCDKVYKSNSKRKEHILKNHPGSKLPDSRERGTAMNDPYAKHVGSVISDPFNCEYCHRQYASRAKLLNHRRKNHSDLLLADQKLPRNWNAKSTAKSKKRSKTIAKPCLENNESRTIVEASKSSNDQDSNEIVSQNMIYSTSSKPQGCASHTNDQIMNLNNVLNEELRGSSSNQDQYLKILQQSSNDISESHVDENSNALLHQILTSYQFPNS